MDLDKIERGVELILRGIGCDLKDHNYLETPERVARMYHEMFRCKNTGWATFPEDYNDFIMLKNHKMFSFCPHHLLPVEFTVAVAYIPDGNVLGLSKLARLLDECNSGPLLQEKFTRDIVRMVAEVCEGIKGAACLIEGVHGCARIRGVKSTGSFTTYKLSGVFADDPKLESRFFDLARR